jgi:hypothetical protein
MKCMAVSRTSRRGMVLEVGLTVQIGPRTLAVARAQAEG